MHISSWPGAAGTRYFWKERGMSMCLKHLAVWTVLASLLLIGVTSVVEAGEPLEKVRQTINSVLDVLANQDLPEPERKAKIREAILQRFNFEEMAKRSLGRHWQKRTPEEQQEFVQLFTDLLENSYIDKIERSEGKENINYTEETIENSNASVRTAIVQKGDQNIDVEYRLLKRNGDWQVYDVVIERVSLVNNYRTQFNKILLQESYEALIKKMKLKSEQLQAAT
jgi:phospholipid transport system substrate-binding protein